MRTKSVLQHKKENNQVYGNIPYGKKLQNGRLVDHDREIFMLKKIKTLRNKGKSYGQITMFLKRNNYLRKNGSHFDRDSVKKLVKNQPNSLSINTQNRWGITIRSYPTFH